MQMKEHAVLVCRSFGRLVLGGGIVAAIAAVAWTYRLEVGMRRATETGRSKMQMMMETETTKMTGWAADSLVAGSSAGIGEGRRPQGQE
jgi:predicted metal-binding membrane protein